jgi:pimeloyl-ACP methyl ester carboxylesterase
MTAVEPFRIEVPEADLIDLRERLAPTRWPEAETVDDWSQGVPLAYLQELCGHWQGQYDWRATEARLNRLDHFRTRIDGLDIHFVRVRSPHPVDRLGYWTFGAQGGDWGSSASTCLAQQYPERVVGLHLTPPLAAPDPATFADLTPAEQASLDALWHADASEDGYSAEQSTKPQTIGYSLVDSPAGLAAWIVEKFCSWSDCDGVPERALDRDRMLDDITWYWLTRTGASAARLYWESIREVRQVFTQGIGDRVDVPTGASIFAHENPRPSRRWAQRRFVDIRHWNELDRGGHFAAWEQPTLFVDEVRTFFRLVR